MFIQSNDRFSFDLEGAFFSAPEQTLWDRRPDLQKAFPDPHGADYDNFKGWFQMDGKIDNDVSKMFQRWKRIHNFHHFILIVFTNKLPMTLPPLGLMSLAGTVDSLALASVL